MKNRFLLACIVIMLSILALGTISASAASSGKYSSNIQWNLNDDGVLTLSGSGAMQKETSSVPYPWKTYKYSVKSIVVNPGITSIAESAFYGFYNLNNVTIPNTVTTINDYAFGYCDLLKNVTFDEGIISIGGSAFISCKSLKKITIPDSVTYMGSHTFYNCSSLENITLSKNLKNIEMYTFYKCEKLKNIEIPESVTSYDGFQTFSGCSSLQEVTLSFGWYSASGGSKNTYILGGVIGTLKGDNDSEELYHFVEQSYANINGTYSIPKSLKKVIIKGNHNIPENAFQNCIGICEFVIDENNSYYKAIDGNLYTKDGAKLCQYALGKSDRNFVMPNNVVEIGAYAFKGSKYIENIVLPDSLTTIGREAFMNCPLVKSIIIPKNVNYIGQWTFRGCENLENISFAEGMEKLNLYWITDCDSIKTVVIPKSIIEITTSGMRGSCQTIENIIVHENNTNFTSLDGNLYSKDLKTFIMYASGKPDTYFELPNDVTYIEQRAFMYAGALKEVCLPLGLLEIGYQAFSYCGLESISIPKNVVKICNNAFSSCQSLSDVRLNDGVQELGDSCFSYCTALKQIAIPNSVKTISTYSYLFSGCESLEEIWVPISFRDIRLSTPKSTIIHYMCTIQYKLENKIVLQETVELGGNAKLLHQPSVFGNEAEWSFKKNGEPWDGCNITGDIIIDVTGVYNACDIVEIIAPSAGIIDSANLKITNVVADGDLNEVAINIKTSPNASWELYRSLSLEPIETKILPLRGAGKTTKAYIVVTSEDKSNTKTYTIEVYRSIKSEPPTITAYERTVSISALNGSKIIYTMDGTNPSEDNGIIYETPFQVTGTVTVKAICLNEEADQYSEITTLVVNGYPDLTVECLYLEEVSNTAEYEFDFVISTEEISGLNAVLMIAGYNRDGKFIGMHTETLYDTKNKVAEVYGEFALEEKATTFKTMLWRGFNSLYPLCNSIILPIE